jgi:hypothetical protein
MNNDNPSNTGVGRPAWNKGKLTGPKPPLRPGHVWSIRARLHLGRRTRDLALFNLAIDSKLRGCDLVALRVDDVAPNGYAIDRANVRQKKTGRPVRFELTEVTRKRWTTTSGSAAESQGNACLPVAVVPISTLRPGSMPASWASGSADRRLKCPGRAAMFCPALDRRKSASS